MSEVGLVGLSLPHSKRVLDENATISSDKRNIDTLTRVPSKNPPNVPLAKPCLRILAYHGQSE